MLGRVRLIRRHCSRWYRLPSLRRESFFPIGGMYTIVENLLTAAYKSGVQFHYNKPVKLIRVSGKRPIVSSSKMDLKLNVILLLPTRISLMFIANYCTWQGKIKKAWQVEYSCSAICFHWGLDKVYPQLGHHSVFLSDEFREGLEKIFKDKSISDHPSFYVHARSGPILPLLRITMILFHLL